MTPCVVVQLHDDAPSPVTHVDQKRFRLQKAMKSEGQSYLEHSSEHLRASLEAELRSLLARRRQRTRGRGKRAAT
jgi:hypothetical protein